VLFLPFVGNESKLFPPATEQMYRANAKQWHGRVLQDLSTF
jgi:hypothetical protein